MKTSVLFLLFILSQPTVLVAIDTGTPGKDGFEVRLVQHAQDSNKHRITWWLTLPDGTPLPRIGWNRPDNLRFFVPVNHGATFQRPGVDTLRLAIHVQKPHWMFDNSVAAFLGLGQRHYYFLIDIKLDADPEYTTNPDAGLPLITEISYQRLANFPDSYLQIELRPFLDVQMLTTISLPQTMGSDSTDGIIPNLRVPKLPLLAFVIVAKEANLYSIQYVRSNE